MLPEGRNFLSDLDKLALLVKKCQELLIDLSVLCFVENFMPHSGQCLDVDVTESGAGQAVQRIRSSLFTVSD